MNKMNDCKVHNNYTLQHLIINKLFLPAPMIHAQHKRNIFEMKPKYFFFFFFVTIRVTIVKFVPGVIKGSLVSSDATSNKTRKSVQSR